jgi:hypothetical protein
MKVIRDPQHAGLDEAVMTTPAGSAALETMVIWLETTVFGPVRQVAFDIRVQVILSPFTGDQVNAGLFIP